MTDEKLEIKKNCFNAVEQINLFQELYFLYDRSNFMKRTFINEINKFLPIYCSGSFYGKTEKEKIDLITGKNAKPFFIEKSVKKRARLTNSKSSWEGLEEKERQK